MTVAISISRLVLSVALVTALVGLVGCTKAPQPVAAEYPLPVPVELALDTTTAHGLVPAISKWMIAPSGRVANWLGQPVDGKEVFEPINVIILDPIAKTAIEAHDRLIRASAAAHFLVRSGHSSGYGGIIDDWVYPELPVGLGDAFSDEPFVLSNNHGRIFGPHQLPEGWLFIGAFSREVVEPTAKVKHAYESMNRSRDAYAHGMVTQAGYSIVSFVAMGNEILNQPSRGTGDHDGIAVFLKAER